MRQLQRLLQALQGAGHCRSQELLLLLVLHMWEALVLAWCILAVLVHCWTAHMVHHMVMQHHAN
jgi:hypothetical protein